MKSSFPSFPLSLHPTDLISHCTKGYGKNIFCRSGGAFLHRPRGPCPVERRLLAEDVGCPPTSSWWVLETPLTLARRGSSKRQSGARQRRRDRRRDRAATTVSRVFNTARHEGNHISGMRKELEEGGSTARREQGELLRWQQVGGCRTRWSGSRPAAATVPKLPYRPDGETSEKTRVTGGHPHKGDSLNPYIATGWRKFPT
jgi:hypothetical protein